MTKQTRMQKAVEGFQAQYDKLVQNETDAGALVVGLDDLGDNIAEKVRVVEWTVPFIQIFSALGGLLGAVIWAAAGPVAVPLLTGVLGVAGMGALFGGLAAVASYPDGYTSKKDMADLKALGERVKAKTAETLKRPVEELIQTKAFKKFSERHGDLIEQFKLVAAGKAAGLIPEAPAPAAAPGPVA